MIFSLQELFSNAQAVTATAVSTNVLNLGKPGTPNGASAPIAFDAGKGNRIPLWISVVESFNNLTSLTISVEVDDNEAFSSATSIFTSPAYTLAQVAAGARNLLPTEIPINTNEQFVRLRYTVAGTAPTLGKITAGVVMGRQEH